MFADELVRREALEGLQSSPEVVGIDEVGEVISQLVMVVVVEAFDGRFLDRPVHSFDLAAIRENSPPDCFLVLMAPGVPDLGEPVFDLMLATDAVEDVLEGINVPIMIGELDAIIGEHDVEPVGHGCDQIAQKGGCGHFPGLLVQFHESELGGAPLGDCCAITCRATGQWRRRDTANRRENSPPDCFLTLLILQPSEPQQYQRESSRAGRP